MSVPMLREIAFQECGGLQVVMASPQRLRIVDGRLAPPPWEHEAILAFPLDDEEQALAWEVLVSVEQDLVVPAMQLVGRGCALRLCRGYGSP